MIHLEDEEIFNECIRLAKMSNCSLVQFGSAIVKDRKILGRGYNVSLTGECKPCLKGEGYKLSTNPGLCYAVHSEWMALLDAINKHGFKKVKGSTLYIAGLKNKKDFLIWEGFTCTVCIRLLKYAGISKVRSFKGNYSREYTIDEAWNFAFKYIKKYNK